MPKEEQNIQPGETEGKIQPAVPVDDLAAELRDERGATSREVMDEERFNHEIAELLSSTVKAVRTFEQEEQPIARDLQAALAEHIDRLRELVGHTGLDYAVRAVRRLADELIADIDQSAPGESQNKSTYLAQRTQEFEVDTRRALESGALLAATEVYDFNQASQPFNGSYDGLRYSVDRVSNERDDQWGLITRNVIDLQAETAGVSGEVRQEVDRRAAELLTVVRDLRNRDQRAADRLRTAVSDLSGFVQAKIGHRYRAKFER